MRWTYRQLVVLALIVAALTLWLYPARAWV